jgi:hypothetical protein
MEATSIDLAARRGTGIIRAVFSGSNWLLAPGRKIWANALSHGWFTFTDGLDKALTGTGALGVWYGSYIIAPPVFPILGAFSPVGDIWYLGL